RCGQIGLDLLALSRNAEELASAEGRREGPHKQASAAPSCSVHFVGDLQRNPGRSYCSSISHSSDRSLLCRLGARPLLPSKTGQCQNKQAAANRPDTLALACSPTALAPD